MGRYRSRTNSVSGSSNGRLSSSHWWFPHLYLLSSRQVTSLFHVSPITSKNPFGTCQASDAVCDEIRLFAPQNLGYKSDLDNIVKAVLDACQGTVFKDDRWVDYIEAVRYITKRERLWLIIDELKFDNGFESFKIE